MSNVVNTHVLAEPAAEPAVPSAMSPPTGVTRVFIPLVTPFLYGMERAVIELFDALRPGVEPYFLQSGRIFQRQPPIIREMTRRGFSIRLLPDKTDWERLAKPRSFVHLCQMVTAAARVNIAIFKGACGKDVLYVPSISAGSSSLLAALRYRLTGRRVIHHFHDLGTTNLLFPLWIPLVTDFIHNTEFGYQTIAKNLPAIKRKHNVVVPYILEVAPRIPEDPEARRLLEGKRNLFFVGQVSRHKGIDILLEAFKQVAWQYPDVMLHLVGGWQDEFRRELDHELLSADLVGRVKFWGFREDAVQLLRLAYLYVHASPPSRFHESFGRSVVEAMAWSVPPVCFRSGALQEIVIHEKTGLLCEESPSSLASALSRFLGDATFRNQCGQNARERYDEMYCPRVVRPLWAQLFRAAESMEQN